MDQRRGPNRWTGQGLFHSRFADAKMRRNDPLPHPENEVTEQDVLVRRIVIVLFVAVVTGLAIYAFASGGLGTMMIAGGLVALAAYPLWRWWR